MIIKPTIGRIVWYWPPVTLSPGQGNRHFVDQPFAAIVTGVCDDVGSRINIAYFDHDGVQHICRAAPLVQEGDSVPGEGNYCAWMPYQVGQAKKHAGETLPGVTEEVHSKSYAGGYRDGYRQAEFDLDSMGLEAFKKQAEAGMHRDAETVHQRGFKEGFEAGCRHAWGRRSEQSSGQNFPVGGYPFGLAIEAARAGCKIYREGWNGRKAGLEQFVVYMEPLQLPPYSTQGTERKVNDRTAKWIGADTPLDCQPYFAMHNGGGHWQPGWLASQSDMLAVDWVIEPAA